MRRQRRLGGTSCCTAPGCGKPIPAWKRFCDGCWKQLPFDRRRAIAQAMSDKAPHIVAQLSIEAAAALAAAQAEKAAKAAAAARRMVGEREE